MTRIQVRTQNPFTVKTHYSGSEMYSVVEFEMGLGCEMVSRHGDRWSPHPCHDHELFEYSKGVTERKPKKD